MAGFYETSQPQYVGPGGTPVATKSGGGAFGLFPGTPEYTQPAPASTPGDAPPSPRVEPAAAELELRIRIPGLVEASGSIKMQPALAALVVGALRDVLEETATSGPAQASDAAPEVERVVSEVERRVWERE